MNTLIVVLGPTGIGKTKLSIALAEEFHVPIINADSRQIFKEIPIGTAAPTLEEQARVKHFFVGNHSITDYYSASLYENDVMDLTKELFTQSKIQLLSGGSMMYIDAVCKGIDDIPTIDEATRALMKKRLEEEGIDSLLADLQKRDPAYFDIVDKKNVKRVVHAMEICTMTGKTYTSYRVNQKKERPFKIKKIGLALPREELYERINKRVLKMVDLGLEKEARRMYPQRTLNALNTVGYKEMFQYFDHQCDFDEAVRRIQSNTRRYCRKQQTWFKKDTEIHWFNPENIEEIIKYIRE